MKETDKLLLSNKAWANERRLVDPSFFGRLVNQQKPHFLWIGCSDSRVPATQITGTDPGEVFVHRNIANLVIASDLNLLSVIQYAVEVLEVTHIIVCGHYRCGGIEAAMAERSVGPLNDWLRDIKGVYRRHRDEIDALPQEARADRLTELNVCEQVANLTKTSLIQHAWKDRKSPWIHGWIYSLTDGLLKELVALPPGSPVDTLCAFDT